MIQRLTRFLLLLQLAAAAGLGWGAHRVLHLPAPAALLFGLAVIVLVRLAIMVNNFALAWHYRSPTPPEHRIGIGGACRLFFGEFAASMWTSSITMPFQRFARRTAASSRALPVLLIHGYACNSGYWQAMSKALTQEGITHCAVDLEPALASIDAYVPIVHRALEGMRNEHAASQAIIVAHSMGGLVARAYFRAHGTDAVARVITLGTPHHGTALAHYGIGTNSAEMRWTALEQEELASPWLRALAASEGLATRERIVSIYSHHDNIIAPQTSSHLPDARNIALHGIGHVALALNRQVQSRVIEEILAAHSPR